MDQIEQFGQRLKWVIRERDILQNELAEQVGVSPKSISSYINQKSLPGVVTLTKIAQTLDVSVDWLLGLTPTNEFEYYFSQLNPEQRKIILALMQTVVNTGGNTVSNQEYLGHASSF